MIAIFKSKLLMKFDKAIKDAKVSGCEIVCFELESEEENQLFISWINMTDGYVVGVDYDYEGVLVREFSAGEILEDTCAMANDKYKSVFCLEMERLSREAIESKNKFVSPSKQGGDILRKLHFDITGENDQYFGFEVVTALSDLEIMDAVCATET